MFRNLRIVSLIFLFGLVRCNEQAEQYRQTGWSSWSSWSVCMTSCGVGLRFRTRSCLVRRNLWFSQCNGPRIQRKHCFKECIGALVATPSAASISTTSKLHSTTTAPSSLKTAAITVVEAKKPSSCPWKCDAGASSCGQSIGRPLTNKKILGGQSSQQHAWPWQVGIWSGKKLLCGGTIICKGWILTAAHCFLNLTSNRFRFEGLTLRLGSYKRNEIEPGVIVIPVRRKNVVIHPRYDIRRRTYDVAMIKIQNPLNFSRQVASACLPDYFSLSVQPGANCYVLGWGETKGHGPPNTVLKQMSMKVLGNSICKLKYSYRSTYMILCAGGVENQDPCSGDSGGPLLCQSTSTGSWELQGIVSFGSRICGKKGSPTVLMQVSFYLPWIRSVMDSACRSSLSA